MDIIQATRNVEDMLKVRCFTKVEQLKDRSYPMIYGSKIDTSSIIRNQTDVTEIHPRVNTSAIVLIDFATSFSRMDVNTAISALIGQALAQKIEPDSSLIYIYSFLPTTAHAQYIEQNFLELSERNNTFDKKYYLESIHISIFDLDWKRPRTTRNWRIVERSNLIFAYGRTKGEPIIIDRPPLISNEDPCVVYIGGRPDDFVMYERLDDLEVGPMWCTTLRKAGKKVEIKLPESEEDDRSAMALSPIDDSEFEEI